MILGYKLYLLFNISLLPATVQSIILHASLGKHQCVNWLYICWRGSSNVPVADNCFKFIHDWFNHVILIYFHYHHWFDGWVLYMIRRRMFSSFEVVRRKGTQAMRGFLTGPSKIYPIILCHLFHGLCCERHSCPFHELSLRSLTIASVQWAGINNMFQHTVKQAFISTGISHLNMDEGQLSQFYLFRIFWTS